MERERENERVRKSKRAHLENKRFNLGNQGVGLNHLSLLLCLFLSLSLSLLNGQKRFCLVLFGPAHELFFAAGRLETDTTVHVEFDISKKSTSAGAGFWDVFGAVRHVSSRCARRSRLALFRRMVQCATIPVGTIPCFHVERARMLVGSARKRYNGLVMRFCAATVQLAM